MLKKTIKITTTTAVQTPPQNPKPPPTHTCTYEYVDGWMIRTLAFICIIHSAEAAAAAAAAAATKTTTQQHAHVVNNCHRLLSSHTLFFLCYFAIPQI